MSLDRYFPISEDTNSETNDVEEVPFGFIEERDQKDFVLARSVPTFNSTFIQDLDRFCYKRFNINETNIEEEFQNLYKKKTFNRGTKGYLQFEIVDTGCGIHPLIQQKLFQPFFQEDSSITRDIGGLGVGLFITKHLIEKMDGKIMMTSEKNSGTSFYVKLPCEVFTGTLISSTNLGKSSTSSGEFFDLPEGAGPVRVLIADDNPYNQTILESYLKKIGIESEVANNGVEALEAFKSKPIGYYSLVFMDLQMPVMDGLTACKMIRFHESNNKVEKGVPIVVVTGNAAESEKRQCLDPTGGIQALFFFRKPFSFSECQIAVQSALNINKEKLR